MDAILRIATPALPAYLLYACGAPDVLVYGTAAYFGAGVSLRIHTAHSIMPLKNISHITLDQQAWYTGCTQTCFIF